MTAETLSRILQSLPRDLETFREVILDRKTPPTGKSTLVAAMAYSTFEGAARLDTCCVIRLASRKFLLQDGVQNLPLSTLQKIVRLGKEAESIQKLLGQEGYAAWEDKVAKLPAAEDILSDEGVRGQFLRHVAEAAQKYEKYEAPSLSEPEQLLQLRNDLLAKVGVQALP